MRSTSHLALVTAALFLVIWPLTVQKPGLPYSMKADEPAYYLMARSLWHDHDLEVEPRDLVRVHDDFFFDAENLILMTRDGWLTTFYAKPYFTSLLVAPLVAAFGANGFVAFNMALLLGCVWLGWRFLRRDNGDALALLFSGAYFFLSAAFHYVFWLQPEISTLFFVTATLFLSLHDFDGASSAAGRAIGRSRWWLAGLAIAPAINAKPPYVIALLPALVALGSRRRLRDLVAVALAATFATAAIAGGQKALTGTWSPYLGTLRRGFNVRNPTVMPTLDAREAFLQERAAERARSGAPLTTDRPQEEWDLMSRSGTDWSWIFGLPRITRERLSVDVTTYLIGRHTGLFVYFPFSLIALLLFATGGGWRDRRRWGLVAGLVGLSAFLLLWNQQNYYGGGGFVGNRYLVAVYSGGLFLVGRIRPRGAVAAGAGLAGLTLGQVVFAPFGPPVDEPTLQAYTRALPFRWLPLEMNLGGAIPGWRGVSRSGAWIVSRKDRVKVRGDWLTVLGRGETELQFQVDRRPPAATFLLRNLAPANRVTLSLGRSRTVVTFPDAPPPPGGAAALVTLAVPPGRRFKTWAHWPVQESWPLRVNPEHAARERWFGGDDNDLIGVKLLYVGPGEVLTRDVYGIDWLDDPRAPQSVLAGSTFRVRVRVANASAAAWTRESPVQVHLAYRWTDAAGQLVAAEDLRTDLPVDLAPGEDTVAEVRVVAPASPGDHRLVLEPVYEYVRWFGDFDPGSRRTLEICVDPDPDAK